MLPCGLIIAHNSLAPAFSPLFGQAVEVEDGGLRRDGMLPISHHGLVHVEEQEGIFGSLEAVCSL